MKKRITAVLMAVLMGAVCMAGCEDKQKAGEPVPLPDKKEVPELENTDQENMDQEETKQKEHTAVLVVSFGTSYNENRDLTIGAIEEVIETGEKKIKICTDCAFSHRSEHYDVIIQILKKI